LYCIVLYCIVEMCGNDFRLPVFHSHNFIPIFIPVLGKS